ncbi:cationic amino acid transporter 2-like isoform X2 [Diabrotica virgifera virgifera]|uniref:Cationic amino acid transporter 2-like n=1 Tax=Diabrotica virgifera virgifera TaxID=50390 RepID=A0A6P7H2W4_DIAVI|nr:cationic amino acid transporter 2-like isoform X2 [Diabrotica virgifera virgifera]
MKMEELVKFIGTSDSMRVKCPTWEETQRVLTRKKVIKGDSDSKLAKVLTTFDLTALGVGSTLGVGVYVLAGDVAKNTAGPAVIISFFIAAVTSVLAGLCYAEFGARVPKAGSAYVYSYVCIGEFFAFIIGWNLILEYLIGSAASTKAIFLYIDELANKTMVNFFTENIPLGGNQISHYADLFSLGLAIAFSIALACGAKESSMINNIFTFVNLVVVLVVIISGLWKVDSTNWHRTKAEAMGKGNGGFSPYGLKGIVKGAARCFYGFIGFDCIATAGEETKNPQKSIPIGVVGSLMIVFCAYFGMSTVMTMILPYYEQDENAPLAYIYTRLNWTVLKYVVSIGAICALFSSLLGAMFPLPRIIYAMAKDGLIFKPLGKVHSHFHTPLMGTLIAGGLTGTLACLFDLNKLTEMMSIGTLLAYSMVAACILILRHSKEGDSIEKEEITLQTFFAQMFNRHTKEPTKLSSTVVAWEIIVFFAFSFILSGIMTMFEDSLYAGKTWIIVTAVILLTVLAFLLLLVSFQPSTAVENGFSVPFIPWVPGISIFTNIYLMTNIQKDTWIKYGYWMAVGIIIYFAYGLWHSTERDRSKDDEQSKAINRSDSCSS